jgi:hypothetical protein
MCEVQLRRPVTLEEFGDFPVSALRMISGPLLEIEKDYGPKLG